MAAIQGFESLGVAALVAGHEAGIVDLRGSRGVPPRRQHRLPDQFHARSSPVFRAV